MTAAAEPVRRPSGAGRLLGLAVKSALSTPGATLAVGFTLAVAQTVSEVLPRAVFAADPSADLGTTLAIGGVGLLIVAALTRGVALAWAVQAGAATADWNAALAVTAVKGLSWAVLAAAAHLALSLWFWTGLVSALAAFFLGSPRVALGGAFGLSLVLAVGVVAAPLLSIWLELALARAVVSRTSVGRAGADAARTMLERPGFVVGAWLATALPAFGISRFVELVLGTVPGSEWAAAGAMGVGLLLLALIDALATVVRLDAYVALELDRTGMLPAPPPPAVPRAALVVPGTILESRPVGPPGPGGGS
jgi:hypothetical protein